MIIVNSCERKVGNRPKATNVIREIKLFFKENAILLVKKLSSAVVFSATLSCKNKKELTQATRAAKSGLNLAILQRVETTHGNVTISTLLALAKGLNVHPQKLISFDHWKFLKTKKK